MQFLNFDMPKKLVMNGLLHAVATTIYIVLVVLFVNYVPKAVNENEALFPILFPISMLILFVVSAAITGAIVFGKPVLWCMAGKKKEGISLLVYTLGFLFLILIVFIVNLLIFA